MVVSETEARCDSQPCKMIKQGFVPAGCVDVDAGIVWVGDPCYILPDRRDNDSGLDYMDMLDLWPRDEIEIDNSDEVECMIASVIEGGVPEERAKTLFEHFRIRKVSEPANVAQFRHEAGHLGKGVCVHAGYGDGTYQVWVRYSNEGDWGIRVAELRVVFI